MDLALALLDFGCFPEGRVLRRRLLEEQGYSFVELMTVFSVMAILMAISVVSMAPKIQHGKVNNAANVVVGDLQYAQLLAVRQRRPMAVIVASATRQYVIRDRDNPTNVYRTRSFGNESEYSLDEMNASPSTSVEFFPNGVARETTTVTLGLDGYQRQVRLTRAGQIRIVR